LQQLITAGPESPSAQEMSRVDLAKALSVQLHDVMSTS